MQRFLTLGLALVCLTACGSLAQPMSAAEFREAIGGSSFGTVTSFDVARPYQQVVDTLELAVQVDFGAHTTVQKKPDGGFYILIAEAVPAGTGGAKVTIYRGRLGKAEQIGAAIRDWANGTNTSCPDLNG
jgi:hypothetical protein